MVKMSDVARLAGVSTMTVSNVLNGRRSVNTEIRRRVLEAVKESGYVMNRSARTLRTGTTGVIGLAVPALHHAYFAELGGRVVAQAAQLGYRVTVEQTGAHVQGEIDAVALARTLEYDGLILSAIGIGPEEARFLNQSIPLVLLGEKLFEETVDHIAMPNSKGTRAATVHLASQGCKRIAWASSPAPVGETHNVVVDRLLGYRQGLADAGLSEDPGLRVPMDHLTMRDAAEGIRQMGKNGVEFDGVVAVTDAVALGIMRGLADLGLRVPQDVRVIGYDDIEQSEFSTPSLSTIAPDHEWMVSAALTLLTERIKDRSAPGRELVAPFRLITRESTS
ncbi:DNA-binding LacI/PurR family transcriptional regulator [Arthrobacter pascens]|uniref:LacI family DNA-binding transcriptional regulator n=1 Tax=Arthrobacter pascens TaxID=1677 RepID=UPI002789FF7E|nr:LacI family DNA-binding transcriptional regulator [Arthrobacter pascens]MDQ0633113.1 DNA-binding LacI/PurR family transcriptional regulator [Arthrobacter pascens]